MVVHVAENNDTERGGASSTQPELLQNQAREAICKQCTDNVVQKNAEYNIDKTVPIAK